MKLPDEMILRICDNMDIGTLLNTVEASSKVYQVCTELIDKRTKDHFISKLAGQWYKCIINENDYRNLSEVSITANGDGIDVTMDTDDEPLFEEMIYNEGEEYDGSDSSYNGQVNELKLLQKLHAELLKRGYKKINKDDLWIYHDSKGGIMIFWPKRYAEKMNTGYFNRVRLDLLGRDRLLAIIEILGIITTGLESNKDLRNLIIEELDNRNQVVFCDR